MKPTIFNITTAILLLIATSMNTSYTKAQAAGKLVFPWWNGDIYTMNVGEINPTLVVSDAGAFETRWSPDGTKILFVGRNGINIVNADGSGLTTVVTNSTMSNGSPVLSPDGSKIAFFSDRDNGDLEIYVMNADGSNQIRLTNNLGRDAFPTWSPDGTKIAFASERNGEEYELYIMNADGSNPTRLTNLPGLSYEPIWSPDGSMIVFRRVADERSCTQIFKIDANGAGLIQLTNNICELGQIVWLYDSSKLFYQTAFTIYGITPDGLQQDIYTTLPDLGEAITFFDLHLPVSMPTETPTATHTSTPTFTPTSTVTPTNTPVGNIFPQTSILDNFNRADGALGSNWIGGTTNFVITNQQVALNGSGSELQWNPTIFGANQEAFVTLAYIDPVNTTLNLFLKLQPNASAIALLYTAAISKVQVYTFSWEQNWVQRGADISLSLTNGDQLGARALSDGTVEVYKNGTLVDTRDVSAWPFNILGGRIGTWFTANSTRVDDFGGGDVTASGQPTILTRQITSSTDDANESAADFDTDEQTVWLGNAGTTIPSYTGLRFTNIAIPQGATIHSAHVEVFMPNNGWITVSFTLVADDVDDSSTFTTGSKPSQRTQTTQTVAHQSATNWKAGNWYALDEMAAVIQEIIDRPGWVSGNSLSIILQGPGGGSWGRKFVASYDGDPQYAARLVISYTAGS